MYVYVHVRIATRSMNSHKVLKNSCIVDYIVAETFALLHHQSIRFHRSKVHGPSCTICVMQGDAMGRLVSTNTKNVLCVERRYDSRRSKGNQSKMRFFRSCQIFLSCLTHPQAPNVSREHLVHHPAPPTQQAHLRRHLSRLRCCRRACKTCSSDLSCLTGWPFCGSVSCPWNRDGWNERCCCVRRSPCRAC